MELISSELTREKLYKREFTCDTKIKYAIRKNKLDKGFNKSNSFIDVLILMMKEENV